MTASTTPIDAVHGLGRRLRGPWTTMGIGAAILAAAYLFDVNRNLLYLSMLFSVSVMMAVLMRRWWTILLGLGTCAYLAGVPVNVADLGTLYPAPRDRPGTGKMWVNAIPEGETWTYMFALGDPGKRAGGANQAGFLYVDGRNLSSLVVRLRGRILDASAFCQGKHGFDHIAVPLGNEIAGDVTVSLRGMPRTTPKIFHGPEVHGFDVFGDAVWLEFTGSKGRTIFEAKRSARATGPG